MATPPLVWWGLVVSEAMATPGTATETEECTLADIKAYAGVIADRTGDYAAGRTTFHETSEDFLAFLASQPHESDD